MVSWEEALNRADQDSGDGDETVWIIRLRLSWRTTTQLGVHLLQ
jgi:hypothetical protein